MAEVWAAQMASSTDKLVLLALADNANDAGVCWPSVSNLCIKTSLAERSVRQSIARLRECGYVEVKPREGHSNWFVVTPASGAPPDGATPAPDAPLHDVHPAPDAGDPCTTCTTTPARGAPTPARGAPRTVKEPSIEPSENLGGRAARAAHRLPSDFELTAGRSDYATQQGIDPQRTFENFRDYWTAASGRTARKHDWDAAWRVWCRRDAERPRGPPATQPFVKWKTTAELEAEEAARNAQH